MRISFKFNKKGVTFHSELFTMHTIPIHTKGHHEKQCLPLNVNKIENRKL